MIFKRSLFSAIMRKGRRLDTICDKWYMQHAMSPSKPAVNPVRIKRDDSQLRFDLRDEENGLSYGRRGTLGNFFEAVGRGIYGGEKPFMKLGENIMILLSLRMLKKLLMIFDYSSTALIRLTPEELDDSFLILNLPSSEVLFA